MIPSPRTLLKRSILAARKLRAAVEPLENRLLLTVTTDANGWTSVTPTPNVTNFIYVSATGLDTNSGATPDAPVRSISTAYGLLRNNEPDWILFKRGDTFAGSFSYFADSGLNAQQPIVITSYGDPTLPRPVIDSGSVTAFRTGTYNHDIYVIGVSFTSSSHDPTSPNYNGTGSYGFYDTGNSTDILIEDCQFSYFVNDITFTDVSGPLFNINVRRNEILNAYSTSGHAQGLYADTVTNLTITDNVFDHDGWNASVPGGGATIYNHDCYLHSSNVNCVVTGNTFADAGSFGLQARAGGVVDNNLFINDPYGFAFGLVNGATTTAGGVSGEVIGNVVVEPRVDAANGWGIGAIIGNIKPGGNTVVSNNIFSGEPTGTQPAIIFEPGTGVSNPQQEVGLNSITFSNNTTYDWGFGLQISNQYVPGTTGSTGLTGVVIRNNNFQDNVVGRIVNHGDLYDPRDEDWAGNIYSSSTTAQSSWFTLAGTTTSFASWVANIEPTAIAAVVPFNDPNRTIESYVTAQGIGTTEAAFISGAIAQNKQNWNPVYFASAVNGFIQAGYTVVTSPPLAVATPPADVTADNYLAVPNPTFTVTFTDPLSIDASTISSASVSVSGAGGATLPVSLVSTTPSGPSVTATYQLSAPGGDWTSVPYGTYVISVVGGQVKDSSGLSVASLPLASFAVSVNADANPPTAAPVTPASISAAPGASSITISWSDLATDQRSYILERALDLGFTQSVQLIPLTPDQTSYVDSATTVGTTYFYQLFAVNQLGQSPPISATSAAILPPAPALSRVILNDGNTARTAITSATLLFTQPVTVDPSDLSLIQNPSGAATPIAFSVSNPAGDGKTWIVSWATSSFNNRLPDGTYALTVHGGSITDAFGQSAGGDQTTTFTSADSPIVTATVRNTTLPPHSISMTFSQDVSASLSIKSLVLGNSLSQSVPAASYAWNASTLTATWTYSGALPDGNYSAQLAATGVTNADGVHLDGNKDGIPGDTYTYNFTVVKPTLSLSGATNVNVGATYSLTLGAITDAGQSNPSYLVHWGDGSTSTATAAGKITHAYSSALGPTTVSVDVIDANGTHANCASLSVSVNRATIALSGNANANPGATYTLNLGTVTDTGFTVSSYIVHWGDGSTNTYSTKGAVTHAYANSTSSAIARQITVDLVDNSGASGAAFPNLSAATLPVTVNAYPFVPTTGVLNANAGGTYTLFIGTLKDTGFTVSNLSLNWGDGTAPVAFTTSTTQLTHVFGPGAVGTDSIRVTLTDNSGTYANASVFTITVNPRPTVGLTGSSSANVGGNYSLTVAPATDPGQSVSLYTVNWGDGSSTSSLSPGAFSHVYGFAASDNITVDITDGTGFFAAAGSLPVTVNNAPTIALSGKSNANAGGVYTLNLGAVNAPGQTITQYTVNWGDNSSDTYFNGGNVTHTYGSPGQDQITVDLTDSTSATYKAAGTLAAITVARPTVNTVGNPGVFVNQTYALTINPATDAGGTPSQYIVNWGDGSSDAYGATGSPIAASHAYSGIQHTIVTTDLVDDTGTFAAAGSTALYVAPPPSLSISGAANAGLGATYTLTLGQASDAIGTVSAYIVNWGDGSSSTINTAAAPGAVGHVYNTPGSQAISVDVVDQYGTYFGAASTSVLVGAIPTLAISGNTNANAGGQYTLTLGAVADSNGTPTGYTIHWGDGQSDPETSTGVYTHLYATPGADNISVDLADAVANWTGVAGQAITVNAAPTVAVAANSHANATGVYTLTFGAATDPGYAVSQYTVNWGDNQPATVTAGGAVTHVYAASGSEKISVALTDATGTFNNAASVALTVNPTPTVALSGASTATAGTPYALTLGTATDPGYMPSGYVIHWGDGSSDTPSTGGVVMHTFAGAVNATIQVDLTDATGTYAAAGKETVSVAAAHVTPTIVIGGNANANTGGVYTLTLGAVTDPGHTVTKYTVHWGDNVTSTFTAGGNVTHTYSKAGSDKITVDLTDSTGTYASVASQTVTVNPKPSIALSGNANANATGLYTLTLGNVTDPGYTPTKYVVHWGDNTTTTLTAGGAVTHTYSATGSKTITVDLTDATGTFTTAGSLAVAVHAKPTVALSGATSTNPGTPYALTLGAVTDVGYAVSKFTVHWGDGSTSSYSSTGVAYHTFTAAASRTITVDITDPTGTFLAAASKAVTISNPTNLFTTSADIGKPPLAGSASFATNGTYTVSGSGSDIYNTTDQFHYDYKSVTGNATITSRVTSVSGSNSWAKAGVMFRNGTAANAAYADIVVTPGGYLAFQYRTAAGAMATQSVIGATYAPEWIKLVRSGNSFSAFYSPDGMAWTQLGTTVTITMSSSASVGLAVTSLSATQLNTATFTNVSVTSP